VTADRLAPRAAPSGIAGRLFDLADRVRRLPPPNPRDPEAFHVAKSDVAAELRRVAHDAERQPPETATETPSNHVTGAAVIMQRRSKCGFTPLREARAKRGQR
jgi:hypothetical protein